MVEETSARILLNQLKTATHFDNLTLQITTEKLNGHNCLEWSQLAKLFLKSRGKMGYLCGTIEEVWDAVSQTYSKKGDSGWIYELKTMIHDKKQKDLSVTTYYNITLKVRGQILGKYPLPSLHEVHSYVHSEESRSIVMMGPTPYENSALNTD
ncbi:hypothetical protein CK203_067511 [Vitis vinifera]|uniref:Retrotransposon Copia-like N-terminal domain-containing protein n=1 Tax=Vitis vinifera TaxID=29760 RepID=A0A438EC00_VITVI|nr:hypothetical protein CK203_067511 [Vitis vinifera]